MGPRFLTAGEWTEFDSPRTVDLGLVSIRDAAIYGVARPLIPYADGRLIKSVRFTPGGTALSSPLTAYFATPNTRVQDNDGLGILDSDPTSICDTTGLFTQDQATGMNGNTSSNVSILDVGPLTLLVSIGNNPCGRTLLAWQGDTAYCQDDALLDVDDHVQQVITNGVTGSSLPTFDNSGGTTNDGSVVWQDQGLIPSGTIHAIAEVIEGISPMPPYPASLEWIAPPVSFTAGDPMPDVTVLVKDQYGNPYIFSQAYVKLWLVGAGDTGGGLSEAQIDQTTGIATITGESILTPGTGYIVRCRASYWEPTGTIFSPPFDVFAP